MIKWRKSWFPVWYGYCPDERSFRKALADSTDPDFPYPDTHGCAVKYDDKYGERRVIVVINLDHKKQPLEFMNVLVHECVHVVHAVVDKMADRFASEEFHAYATQAIFAELLNDISEYNARK